VGAGSRPSRPAGRNTWRPPGVPPPPVSTTPPPGPLHVPCPVARLNVTLASEAFIKKTEPVKDSRSLPTMRTCFGDTNVPPIEMAGLRVSRAPVMTFGGIRMSDVCDPQTHSAHKSLSEADHAWEPA